MDCPSCGAKNPQDYKYCNQCGAKRTAEVGNSGSTGLETPKAVPAPETKRNPRRRGPKSVLIGIAGLVLLICISAVALIWFVADDFIPDSKIAYGKGTCSVYGMLPLDKQISHDTPEYSDACYKIHLEAGKTVHIEAKNEDHPDWTNNLSVYILDRNGALVTDKNGRSSLDWKVEETGDYYVRVYKTHHYISYNPNMDKDFYIVLKASYTK